MYNLSYSTRDWICDILCFVCTFLVGILLLGISVYLILNEYKNTQKFIFKMNSILNASIIS